MASQTPTELARKALDELKDLQAELNSVQKELSQYDFLQAVQRIAVIEEKLGQLARVADESKRVPVLDDRVAKLEARTTETDRLRERVAVLEGTAAELVKSRDESGKRGWQFVFIAAGAGLALLSSFLVQLVFYFIKK